MSVYNIRNVFSYTISTSSISYVRNYNFNTATVTDIELSMTNTDDTLPITVNITTTEPWMAIVDPITGANKKYPDGNVVLPPTSSAMVLLKIDLPPEIESIPETTLYPYINLDITSGSFPVISTTTTTTTGKTDKTNKNNTILTSIDSVLISVGESIGIDISVYDLEGNIDTTADVLWMSDNETIAQVDNPNVTEMEYNPYTPRYIRGVSPGTTTVTIKAGDQRTTSIPVVIKETPSSPPPPPPEGDERKLPIEE